MRVVIFVCLLFSLPLACNAQEIFTGMVGDSATFTPLPYVTVRIKNQGRGTITNEQGNFRIQATRQDTLIFSFVGYKPLALALYDWEPSMVLLPEQSTMLNNITIRDTRIDNPYEGMFDEENQALRRANKGLPFYYSKSKKQKAKLIRLGDENIRVKTYVDAVIKNDEIKINLMEKYSLTEAEYYTLLGDFNAQYYTVMYYITTGELVGMLNNFFARRAVKKQD